MTMLHTRRLITKPYTQIPRLLGVQYFTSQPYEASFDQDQLREARQWRETFKQDSLPKGTTSYDRSSGPGGQHVNKTESKATTSWPLSELLSLLPQILHSSIRSSKLYSSRTDSIQLQAQTHRDRARNAAENRQKLFEEIKRIYGEVVPGKTSEVQIKRVKGLEKAYNAERLKAKHRHSDKKALRKGW